jgi:hypothetical protein
MVSQDSLLVILVKLVDRLPMPMPPAKRGRGHPKVYPDRLFLKALVIMIVRHLHTVHELLGVLAQPTPEIVTLRGLLTEQRCYPSHRTWERRLKALPDTLRPNWLPGSSPDRPEPALHPRAVAIDSTLLRSRAGVWHQKHHHQAVVPHTSIDTEAHWTKSGWHALVYGCKLHVVCVVATVWFPMRRC